MGESAVVSGLRLAVIGDSIAAGRGASSWPNAFPSLLADDLDRLDVRTVKLSGFSTGGITTVGSDLNVDYAILYGQPDIAVLTLGLNDQKPLRRRLRKGRLPRDRQVPVDRYEERLGFFVDRLIRQANATVLVTTPPPLYPDGNGAYRAAAIRVAERFASDGARLVDLGDDWPAHLVADDGAHPSDAGHRLIADRCLAALQERTV